VDRAKRCVAWANNAGSSGSVIGVDIDGKIGREALGVLRSMGKSNFDFVEGDF
jgi:ubiquinone/menaquinone biosynthesis C-methylase UbiE